MRNLVLTLFMTLFAFGLNAEDSLWFYNSGNGYDPSATKIIITRTSPCNQGGEAFMDFIPKFRKKKTFRDKRIVAVTEDGISIISSYWFSDWHIIKAGKKIISGVEYYGSWFNISADQVCFIYSMTPVNPIEGDWGGSSIFFRFERIEGKWYLTDSIRFA